MIEEEKVNIFFEDIEAIDIDREATERWLFRCIKEYEKDLGEINFIFKSDEGLLEMNKEHLNHDYYTDIITFNYNVKNVVSGDLFISIDRVKDNAKDLSINFVEELRRVMIHGVLHLVGFNDKTIEEENEMRSEENFCLTKW